MAITLTIASTDRTEWLKFNSARISRDLGGGATMDCVIEDRGRGYTPVVGNAILVEEGSDRRFAGNIRSIVEFCHPPLYRKQFRIRALDHSNILDRRRVQGAYENMTLRDMVLEMSGQALSGEGITFTGVATGPTIVEKMTFNLETVREALQRLSVATSAYGAPYLFYLDFDKDLKFSQFASNPAPFSLTDGSNNFYDFEIERTLDDYRNVQWARTEFPVAPTYTESFVGNGALIVFPTTFTIAETPTLTVNGTPVTVGELGVDHTGKDFYWVRNGIGIFNQDYPTLSGSQTLAVTYRSAASNVLQVRNASEVSARASAQGDSGRFESVIEQRNIDTYAALLAAANGSLGQADEIPSRPSFRTRTSGLEPGQRLSINLTRHGINASYLIESVSMDWRAAAVDFFECSVRCTSVDRSQPAPTAYLENVISMARIGVDPPSASTGSTTPVPGVTNDGYYTMTVGSGSVTPDLENGLSQASPPGGNLTVNAPIYTGRDIVAGMKLTLKIPNDGTGGGVVTWNAIFIGVADMATDPRPNTYNKFQFTFSGTNWELDFLTRGLS